MSKQSVVFCTWVGKILANAPVNFHIVHLLLQGAS